jgi:hypothetical protein
VPVEHPSRDSVPLLEQAACQHRAGGRRSGARVSAPGPERRGRTRRRKAVVAGSCPPQQCVGRALGQGVSSGDTLSGTVGTRAWEPQTRWGLGCCKARQTPHTPAGLMGEAASMLPEGAPSPTTPAKSTLIKFTYAGLSDPPGPVERSSGCLSLYHPPRTSRVGSSGSLGASLS